MSKHEQADNEPAVTHHGFLDTQVCVPADWTDDMATTYANVACPCGTRNGWVIRKQEDYGIEGAKERQPCEKRPGFVHIMFDA